MVVIINGVVTYVVIGFFNDDDIITVNIELGDNAACKKFVIFIT